MSCDMHYVPVYVENHTGEDLTDVHYAHRYDNDVHEVSMLSILESEKLNIIGKATFWTGFLCTGYDYWWVKFTRNNEIYTCKGNFYCYLTKDDADGRVVLKLYKDKMEVHPYASGSCTVSLQEESALHRQLQADRLAGRSQADPHDCGCNKKKASP